MESAEQLSGTKIHVLSADVCRKICTGQVVITLSGACKELIDNALDAGAKTIEIRVKKMGFDSLEVTDDGTGIQSVNFDSLCKPHATSKLINFEDFNQLTTFGFRGEALSSLCALSSVTITTRHVDEVMATQLQFDHDGSIKSRKGCARPIGTTVTVNNLFETLPVRRMEFERTVKKAFMKLLITVQSIALSRTDVRFVVNSLVDGKQHQALVTPGGDATIKDVIINLFGARFGKDAILDIVQKNPDESICALYGISNHSNYDHIRISGYVSSCLHGQGRSTADRQFIYFNKRPVDYAKLCRIANEVYQQYNHGQYCLLILFVDVDPESIDVNVSPDKRSVFFEREKELFALLRASLLATFAPHLGEVETSKLTASDDTLPISKSADDSFIYLTQANDIDEAFDVSAQSFQSPLESKDNIGPPTAVSFISEKPRGPSVDLMDIKDAAEMKRKRFALKNSNEKFAPPKKRPAANLFDKFAFKKATSCTTSESTSITNTNNTTTDSESSSLMKTFEERQIMEEEEEAGFRKSSLRTIVEGTSRNDEIEFLPQDDVNISEPSDDEQVQITTMECKESKNSDELESNATYRTQQTVPFSMSDLKNRMDELRLRSSEGATTTDDKKVFEPKTEFRIDDSEMAESELAAHISKKDFELMEIVGQFNKGFIIARLNNDLFIIDQHASDEKYNFERFQKKARIQTQRLIRPRMLDLGVVKEAILRDNIDIFNCNGFEFRFDDDELVGKRALLTAVPVLHSWQFSISGTYSVKFVLYIDEMLSVLCDFPGTMYRPAKLRKLFASRACRKSVMIGTSLSLSQMERIVRHLGTLDHPWNCPHGRPTLRHLCSLIGKTVNKIDN